jgi:hypothetical protein
MLNRRADEVEKLRKVFADMEHQFAACLQQIKIWAKRRGSTRRNSTI